MPSLECGQGAGSAEVACSAVCRLDRPQNGCNARCCNAGQGAGGAEGELARPRRPQGATCGPPTGCGAGVRRHLFAGSLPGAGGGLASVAMCCAPLECSQQVQGGRTAVGPGRRLPGISATSSNRARNELIRRATCLISHGTGHRRALTRLQITWTLRRWWTSCPPTR